MPKRLVLQTILLDRKGESVRPTIGQPFDFKPEELSWIERLNPDAVGKVIAGDDAGEGSVETLKLTQADLDKEKADAVNAAREQIEQEVRAQVLAEQQAAKPAGDTQNGTAKEEKKNAKPETVKTEKTAKGSEGEEEL
jgi:hypothetical protein